MLLIWWALNHPQVSLARSVNFSFEISSGFCRILLKAYFYKPKVISNIKFEWLNAIWYLMRHLFYYGRSLWQLHSFIMIFHDGLPRSPGGAHDEPTTISKETGNFSFQKQWCLWGSLHLSTEISLSLEWQTQTGQEGLCVQLSPFDLWIGSIPREWWPWISNDQHSNNPTVPNQKS